MSQTAMKVESQQVANSLWQYTSLISTVYVLITSYHSNPRVRQPPYLPDMIYLIWWEQNWTQYNRLMFDKSKNFVWQMFPTQA
jgi:hypothetical protein